MYVTSRGRRSFKSNVLTNNFQNRIDFIVADAHSTGCKNSLDIVWKHRHQFCQFSSKMGDCGECLNIAQFLFQCFEYLRVGLVTVASIAGSPLSVLKRCFLLIGEVLAAPFCLQQQGSNSCKIYESFFFNYGNSSFKWAEVLWSGDDGLHVSIFHRYYPSNTLALLDKYSSTVGIGDEAYPSVGHHRGR